MSGVIVLGGSGHLGTALRARLPQAAFAHHRTPLDGSLPFDFRGSEPLPAADVVIGSFPLARQLQGATRREIAASVTRYIERCGGARIAQLSTDAVFSGERGSRSETDPPDPQSAYGQAQAEVDELLLEKAPNVLIVRTSFIFGWSGDRLDKRLAPLAARPALAAEETWPGDVFRSPTEVNFLAEGIARAIERQVSGILNIAGPRLSIADFFARALPPLGAPRLRPAVRETRPDVARDTSLSTARMMEVLDMDRRENWSWYPRFLPTGLGASPTGDSASAA